jgi:hypothetical protein
MMNASAAAARAAASVLTGGFGVFAQTHTFGSHIVAAMPSRETTASATGIFRRVKPCVGARRIAWR